MSARESKVVEEEYYNSAIFSMPLKKATFSFLE
jgi:hypothetical protein